MATISGDRRIPISRLERAPLIELRGAILDVGILRDTLLPSFTLHSGLSLLAYGISRSSDRVDGKDWLWPSAQVLNVWWSAIGRRVVYHGFSSAQALSSLSRPEYLLLGGVTLWGSRLFYHVASRSLERGKDDARYTKSKTKPGFWNEALYKLFLPEAIAQTLITLPFTAPFVHQGGVFTGYHPWIQAFAVAVFGTGFAMEVLADWQLEKFEQNSISDGTNREGVWSVVRHPKYYSCSKIGPELTIYSYLGDFLVHASFPILLYASDMLAPIELLGPLVNYLFLRYVRGDYENEASQEARYTGEKQVAFEAYRDDEETNAFWPSVKQLFNPWLWNTIGLGVAFSAVEQIVHQLGFD